jgi:hypothetical protein
MFDVRIIQNTLILNVNRMQIFLMAKQVVYIVINVLLFHLFCN